MSLSDDLDVIWVKLKQNLLFFDGKNFANDQAYSINFLKWIYEITEKNKYIHLKKKVKDLETIRRRRQNVYWLDFGKNIGSEFNDWHFAVVIRESLYTAVVVPLSTEKETVSDWKKEEDLIIPIGVLDDLPKDKKPCYAMIHQIQVVSKQRLNSFGNKRDGYIEIKLGHHQMDKIDDAIRLHFVKQIKEK